MEWSQREMLSYLQLETHSRVQKILFLLCKENALLEQLRDEFTPLEQVVTDANGDTCHSREGGEN
jgi:hypothetical protein